ncbi:MAG: hypothetical protein OEM29_05315 [Thermoplasmata archaeon]|nr:hypothetical protein [Thermoplasmata archaeon]
MPDRKCPMCDGTCILKVIMTESADKEEVDVCSACGTMYPRDKDAEKCDKPKE